MKVGLLGTGKTGSMLIGLEPGVETVSFNSKNKPSLEKLSKLDVIVAFIDGEIFNQYLPLLIESKVPVVSGATGKIDLEDTHQKLKEAKLAWIWGSNFSLGMTIVKRIISILGDLDHLYDSVDFSIHEVHHTKKLDAPSGTAKSWAQWLKRDCQITSEREGDVVGIHHLNIETDFEKINLTHESKDRKLFAKGALWAAKQLVKGELPYGLHPFDNIVDSYLGDKNVL